ncbi:MAG: MFS transporter [Acidimicrobiales bacterium]
MQQVRPPIWFIYGITVCGILANTLLTPNVPDILADLGQPEGRAGILVASAALPGVFIAPIIGVFADRWGRRPVLLPCMVIFGVAALLSSVAPTFPLLIGARLIQGIGSAGLINLAVVLIGDHWSGYQRTRLIGHNSAVLTVCLALVPSLGGLIAEWSSWRWALACGGIALPMALAGVWILPARRPDHIRSLRDQLDGARRAISDRVALAIVGTGFLLFVVVFGVFLTALPVHLEQEFGLGPGARGLVLSAPAIGSTFSAINLARFRARFGLRPMLVGASALVSVAALGVGIAPTVTAVVVASVVYGLGDGSLIPNLQDAANTASPPSQRAAVMAAWVSAVRLGQTVGPITAAALFAATSTEFTMLVGAALFAVVAVFLAVGPISEEEIERAGAA